MYQVNNAGKFDIHNHAKQLPTTRKAVINAVLDSNIANDCCGAWKIFLDNGYSCPELFAILFEEIKIIGGGTCRKYRIVFPVNDEQLIFPKGE